MRKLILLAAVAALILVALPVGSASADSPFEKVSLEVNTEFGPGMPPNGSFTASGPAVGDGLICESGWSFDPGVGKFSPRENPKVGVNIQVVKIFLCGATSWTEEVPDGFVMRWQIRFDKKGGSIKWVVVDGWGKYADIAGNGKGSSFGSMAEGFTDSLSGKVR